MEQKMKLLLENWRKYITEDWRDTSWETDDEKVTIGDVVGYLGDETVDINVLELSQQLPSLPTQGAERVAAASLEYFDKAVSDLNYEEAALLAALPRAPSKYNPYKSIKMATIRRNIVFVICFGNHI